MLYGRDILFCSGKIWDWTIESIQLNLECSLGKMTVVMVSIRATFVNLIWNVLKLWISFWIDNRNQTICKLPLLKKDYISPLQPHCSSCHGCACRIWSLVKFYKFISKWMYKSFAFFQIFHLQNLHIPQQNLDQILHPKKNQKISTKFYPDLFGASNGCLSSSSCHFSWRKNSWEESSPAPPKNRQKYFYHQHLHFLWTIALCPTCKWTTVCSMKRIMMKPMPIVN